MAKPFFPWMGNKEKLVPYIHQLIPPHVKQFTEAFGGSGAVILGLQPKKGRLDIYNDLNDDLFNVFCCVKEKSFSLAKELKFLPVHGRTPFAFYRDMAAHEPDFYRCSSSPIFVIRCAARDLCTRYHRSRFRHWRSWRGNFGKHGVYFLNGDRGCWPLGNWHQPTHADLLHNFDGLCCDQGVFRKSKKGRHSSHPDRGWKPLYVFNP